MEARKVIYLEQKTQISSCFYHLVVAFSFYDFYFWINIQKKEITNKYWLFIETCEVAREVKSISNIVQTLDLSSMRCVHLQTERSAPSYTFMLICSSLQE